MGTSRILTNYHTHTYRCNHARGTEREYIETAIERGVQILGFSDHAPHAYPEGYVSDMRMPMSLLEDYVDSVNALRKEYAHEIEIHLGLEAEYYPDYFENLIHYVKDYGIEYLLLGQHYLGNEIGEQYVARASSDIGFLKRYCKQTIEAMETGAFVCFSHPDIIRDMGRLDIYEEEMRKLCQTANRCDVLLEINMQGIRSKKHYPNDYFWKIAGEEGCSVILGSDAHAPENVCIPEVVERAYELVEKYDLNLVNTIRI